MNFSFDCHLSLSLAEEAAKNSILQGCLSRMEMINYQQVWNIRCNFGTSSDIKERQLRKQEKQLLHKAKLYSLFSTSTSLHLSQPCSSIGFPLWLSTSLKVHNSFYWAQKPQTNKLSSKTSSRPKHFQRNIRWASHKSTYSHLLKWEKPLKILWDW